MKKNTNKFSQQQKVRKLLWKRKVQTIYKNFCHLWMAIFKINLNNKLNKSNKNIQKNFLILYKQKINYKKLKLRNVIKLMKQMKK